MKILSFILSYHLIDIKGVSAENYELLVKLAKTLDFFGYV